MEIKKILKSDYLDLLFDGRNKKYGSYQLRKGYNRRISLGMTIAFSIFILLFLSTLLRPKAKVIAEIPVERKIIIQPLLPPDHKILPPILKNVNPVSAAPKTVKVTPPVISKDVDVTDADKFQMVKPDDHAVVGPADIAGTGDPTSIQPGLIGGGSGGNGNDHGFSQPDKDVPFRFVDQLAGFPGGEAALAAYLQKNLRYPVAAKTHGLSGTVQIQFVVDLKGNISQVTILRDIGGGCGQEALRVVQNMPKWTPAKNNGHAVKSFFILPIQFSLK